MSKTSMSVMEMGKMLGLKKTDSYWLVHKGLFETRIVASKMRIMIESFEKWYANQLHYKKVNGEMPGKELLQRMMTVQEMASLLGISDWSAYELINRIHFQVVKKEFVGQRLLIDRQTFYLWLENQSHYKIIGAKEDCNV